MASKKKILPVYRDGKVHVCRTMCKTCIFRRDGNEAVEPARRDGMVKRAIAKDGSITCHSTLYGGNNDEQAICRGFFELRATPTLRAAESMGVIEFVDLHDDKAKT